MTQALYAHVNKKKKKRKKESFLANASLRKSSHIQFLEIVVKT
jgi:hypothetical protein